MRTLNGIMFLFLTFYILSFTIVERKNSNYVTSNQNGKRISRPTKTSFPLTISFPKESRIGPTLKFSVFWLIVPFLYGIYSIVMGELHYYKSNKLQNDNIA